jgi:hypothetical protein
MKFLSILATVAVLSTSPSLAADVTGFYAGFLGGTGHESPYDTLNAGLLGGYRWSITPQLFLGGEVTALAGFVDHYGIRELNVKGQVGAVLGDRFRVFINAGLGQHYITGASSVILLAGGGVEYDITQTTSVRLEAENLSGVPQLGFGPNDPDYRILGGFLFRFQ